MHVRTPFLALPLALAALCARATTAAAQSMTSLGIAAGATIPTGDFGNQTDVGYHGMVTLDVHPPLAPVGVRLDGMFNELDYRSNLTSGKSHIWAATANLVLNPSGFAGPYLIGGGGIYHQTIPTLGLAQSHTIDKPGLNAGAGFRIGLTGFYAFVEARFHKVLDESTTFVPITFGLVF